MELFAWYVASFMRHPDPSVEPQEGLRVAYLTAFVPGNEPYAILEKTLKGAVAVDYPHDTWLLDEGDDEIVKQICKKYGVYHYSRKGKEHYNMEDGKFKKKTKGGNYNSWLHQHDDDYDIVVQHDVDFVPKRNFLTETLGYFRDPQVAFVGTPQVYGNLDESWIARGAAEQTFSFYGPMQKGFYGHDMTLLIGANHLMRVSAFKDIEGYTAHITEDMLTGMKLYANKWKSVYVPKILLVGEGPGTWGAYLSQQMRWAYGCMDIAFRQSSELFKTMDLRHVFNYLVLQQFYFTGLAQVVGIFLLTLYFFFGFTSANMELKPILMFYVPLIVFQIVFSLWMQRFNCDPKTERGIHIRARLLSLAAWPIYFIAFIKAVQGKRLVYVVTPKGKNQNTAYVPSLFVPHLVLGTITAVGVAIGFILGHNAPQIVFWGVVNTAFMLSFFFLEMLPLMAFSIRKVFHLVRAEENVSNIRIEVSAPVFLQEEKY
jgi:cellulose synthase/poly-beta-1,6-N-acetylglucosamine synthase-like glycosyltransferase